MEEFKRVEILHQNNNTYIDNEEDNMQYTITQNNQFNSLEVSFNGKPSKEVRDNLKALKYRWNPKKCIWYGYSKEDELVQALSGGLDNNDKIEQIETGGNFSEGYLGAAKWEGINCHKDFELKDVNKYLKQVCRKNYGVDIRTKYHSYSMGQSTNIDIKLNNDSFLEPEEMYNIFMNSNNTSLKNYVISETFLEDDENHFNNYAYLGRYNDASEEERKDKIIQWYTNKFKYEHPWYVRSSDDYIFCFLKDNYRKAANTILNTLSSFNYDDSNSMVDYYDTNFYSFVYLNFLDKE